MFPIRIKACSESDLRMLGNLARNIQRVLPVTQADIDAAAALGKNWVVWKVIEVNDPIDNLRGGTQLVIKQNSITPGQNVRRVLIVQGPGGETVVIGPGPSPLLLPDAVANSLSYVKAFGGTEQRNIPQPYTQVNYVTNTAQTAVNTGIMIDFAKNYEFEVECRAVGGSWYILQSRETTNSNITGISGSQTGRTITLVVGNVTACQSAITRTVGNKLYVKATLNNGVATLYVKDETAGTEDTQTGSYGTEQPNPPTPVYLLGNAGGNYAQINSDIYMARIKENDTVVMDYVPARQVATAGFYDTVSGTFKTALTPANLVADGNTVPTPDTPMDIVSNNGVVKARHQSGLPLGYTLLDYIEAANGTQYITTNIIPDWTTEIDAKFRTGNDKTFTVLSRWTNSPTADTFGVIVSSTSSNIVSYFGRYSDGLYHNDTSLRLNANQDVEYKLGENSIQINTRTYSITRQDSGFENVLPLWIFKGNFLGEANNVDPTGSRVYSLKIKTQGALVFDGVPAKNASGIVGLYDTVSGQFFTNAGTGVFVAGDPVSDPVEIYADGAVEIIKDSLNNTATAEMLLKAGDYQDEQEIISGVVTRNVGVKVLDGTETWGALSDARGYYTMVSGLSGILPFSSNLTGFCTHFKYYYWEPPQSTDRPMQGTNVFGYNGSTNNGTNGNVTFKPDMTVYDTVEKWKAFLANQYAAGTPVIVIYPLATATTESVTGQTLQVTGGDNVLEITQASLSGLELEAEYTKTA